MQNETHEDHEIIKERDQFLRRRSKTDYLPKARNSEKNKESNHIEYNADLKIEDENLNENDIAIKFENRFSQQTYSKIITENKKEKEEQMGQNWNIKYNEKQYSDKLIKLNNEDIEIDEMRSQIRSDKIDGDNSVASTLGRDLQNWLIEEKFNGSFFNNQSERKSELQSDFKETIKITEKPKISIQNTVTEINCFTDQNYSNVVASKKVTPNNNNNNNVTTTNIQETNIFKWEYQKFENQLEEITTKNNNKNKQ